MRKLMTFMVLMATCLFASAQDIKVQAPELVSVDEQFNVTFVVEGESSNVDCAWDAGSDFKLVWGPSRGSSSSTTIINGKRSRSVQMSFTYVLMPKKTGRFTLPQADVTIKGKSYKSPSHSIEVVADNSSSANSGNSSAGSGGSAASSGTVSSSDLYMKLILNKRNVVVGEPVKAVLKIYQRANILGYENATFPDFHGFWSQETYVPRTIEFHRENVNDQIFDVATIREWNLIPQQAGELVVDPAELICLVNIRSQRQSTGSIFDDFFQDDYQTIRKRVSTDPVKITVSKLPSGAPSSFAGGVGKFNMKAQLSKDSLSVHDAASLIVSVTGTGNTALLEAPAVSFPPDFEVYDVKTSDIKDGKSFEYPFIPRSYGDFTIGPVEYSYYDIDGKKYVTVSSGPLALKVGKGSGNAADSVRVVTMSGNRGKDVKTLSSDIRYIAVKAPALRGAPSFFVGTTGFYVLLVAILLIAAAIYAIVRFVRVRRNDVVGTKTRTATKMARKRLARAEDFLKKGLLSAFYEELHKALLGYVSDKFAMDASELGKDSISEKLTERGVEKETVAEYIALLDECEYARYAPDTQDSAMDSTYEKAVGVISRIDACMKKHKKTASVVAPLLVALMLTGTGMSAVQAAEYPDSLWNAGVNAYSSGQWNEAVEAWSSLLDLGIENAPLYYNLGNAWYKENDMAHAILCYERALKIDPSYSDAAYNLEFARAGIQDKIVEVPAFFLTRWVESLGHLVSSNVWVAIAFIFLVLCAGMVLMFLLARSSAASKAGFITAIVSLVLSVSAFALAGVQKADYNRADSAVVMSPVCSVRSAPSGTNAKDLFVLHEGTKVEIVDRVGEWINIELSDGRQGWMLSSDIEII